MIYNCLFQIFIIMAVEEEKVSVILPAYNEEKTIGYIVRQARKHAYEVVVIDDGSWDKTAENALKE
jgi:glycosyltransferase involved in cell wall biosynthesis